jgi:hypothetical protein
LNKQNTAREIKMKERRTQISPFNVISGLPLDYPMQDFRVTEERDDELPVTTNIHTTRHHLMHNIVNGAVQKVVPRKGEEQFLFLKR